MVAGGARIGISISICICSSISVSLSVSIGATLTKCKTAPSTICTPYMCVIVYIIHEHANMYGYLYICTYTCNEPTHVYTYAYAYTYAYTCAYTYTYTCAYTYTPIPGLVIDTDIDSYMYTYITVIFVVARSVYNRNTCSVRYVKSNVHEMCNDLSCETQMKWQHEGRVVASHRVTRKPEEDA